MRVPRKTLFLLILALFALSAQAQDFHKMSFEQLPSLNTPRGVGQPMLLNDEVTVFGGHTTGYKPEETAEYYRSGAWHSIPMMYPHDGGAITQFQDGRVFLAGGNAEAFGIGQSWGAEIYDPQTHSFAPIGIMNCKRSLLAAVAMSDRRVLVAGNWHGPDGVEVYAPGKGFSTLKAQEPGLCYPYILPISADDAIFFSPMESSGDTTGIFVQHLNADAVEVPLLAEWVPIFNYATSDDEQKIAEFTYLILANRRDGKETSILKVAAGEFSILELDAPIPQESPFGDAIFWSVGPQVDRSGRLAWIQGYDTLGRIYFARIGYNPTFDGGKASVQLYYAEKPDGFPYSKALLMPGGRLMLVGGVAQVPGNPVLVNDNFNTSAEVYLFHTEEPKKASGVPLWAIIAGAILIGGAVALLLTGKKKAPEEESADKAQKLNADLMEEMKSLIQEKGLFLRKDLRVADVAQELATNQTYVSMLVNNLSGDNFSTMIAGYRIRHAQKLMREHPEMVHEEIAEASGFASRTAFLRTFKAQTGLTPTEWKKQNIK